jgi:hypothetical protein
MGSMKQSGRTSVMVLITGVGVIILAIIFFFSSESLESIGGRFMTALATGDVDTLSKMSYLGKESPDQVKKEWEFATKTAGLHYVFVWRITSALQSDANSGSVRMQVTRNADKPGAYEESYQLPMTKVDGDWKIDVQGISREMYPALPR